MIKHLRLGIWTLSIIVLLCLETIRNGCYVCLEVGTMWRNSFPVGPPGRGHEISSSYWPNSVWITHILLMENYHFL